MVDNYVIPLWAGHVNLNLNSDFEISNEKSQGNNYSRYAQANTQTNTSMKHIKANFKDIQSQDIYKFLITFVSIYSSHHPTNIIYETPKAQLYEEDINYIKRKCVDLGKTPDTIAILMIYPLANEIENEQKNIL